MLKSYLEMIGEGPRILESEFSFVAKHSHLQEGLAFHTEGNKRISGLEWNANKDSNSRNPFRAAAIRCKKMLFKKSHNYLATYK